MAMKVNGVENNNYDLSYESTHTKKSAPSIWLENGSRSGDDKTDLEITMRYKEAKKAYEEGIKQPNTPEGHRKLEQEYLEAKAKWQQSTPEGITNRYKEAKKAYEEGKNQPNTPEGHRKLEQEYLETKAKWQQSTPEGITNRYKEAKKAYEEGKNQPNTPEGHRQLEQEYLEAKRIYDLIK